jgi:hypothetical protein
VIKHYLLSVNEVLNQMKSKAQQREKKGELENSHGNV